MGPEGSGRHRDQPVGALFAVEVENARVIVLAGEETITKDLTELNNGKNILLGVDNKYLVVDSYVRVMEMLEIASKLALDPDTPPSSPNIPMERRGSF